ncbi:hypothetical protein [Micromonospora sp. WMMD1155]|uniref:hypothetical protein n=1 Tax=Micromonospora sp. WMMD1155 TaxID=3016094 RepID=UPI00249CC0E8|nr:hypothetical protein [Micromonospora sp. WMMD1155]WFE51470.1 hypothetical protein O7617_14565 [Micromonospora sp. WMMD1155]
MTSPTRPERQVQDDLTAAGNPEGELTERGWSQDIEAEAQLSGPGGVQATVRIRDSTGRTSASWCYLVEVIAAAVWPVIALIACIKAKASAEITLSVSGIAFAISLAIYLVHLNRRR